MKTHVHLMFLIHPSNKKISSQLMKFLIIILLLVILYQNMNRREPLNNVKEIADNDKYFDDNTPVNVLENFISPNEANQLIKLGNDRFIRSTVVGDQNIDVGRTSSTAHFDRAENELIKKIENKVAQMLKVNPNQIEPLQIQRYRKGQEYRPHYDLLDANNNSTHDREHTVIIYLNDLEVDNGGATFFPIYKIRVFPHKGRAVHFRNIRTNGSKNLDTLHGGDPILGDKPKYILSAWIHNTEFKE